MDTTSFPQNLELPQEDGPPQEMSGVLNYVQFVNKGGRAIPGVGDYFLDTGKESYFIRLDKGKVSAETLKPLTGQKIRMEASLREGLWETDDPNVQSRIGKYIVVFRILPDGK